MAASIWWVILALTWLLAAGLKWGSEAISKYSQVFHFIAWSLPASQTALALLLSIVEGDPISGLCTIQSNKSITYILFIFAPLLIYLIIGIILMIIGFIALFHIRGTIKLQRPRLIETQKLDKLILRIGIFGMLYTIPNLIILFSIGYELRHTYLWQLGIACHCHYDIGQYYQINNNQEGEKELEPILPIALPVWNSPKPEYIIIMLKHFMNLMIGIISGFWIWSNKTIQSWKQFCLHKLCLFQLNKYKSNSNGLLINPIHHHIDYDRLHKKYIKQSIYIPSIKSIQSMTHNKSIHQSINQYPIFIDNNEHCNTIVMTTNSSITITTTNTTATTTTTTTTTTNTLRQHNITSYDLMNNGILSNINSLVTLSTPSTPFSTHPYDIPNHHDINYKSSLNAYYSIDGSTISQQYGDVNSYHTNNSFSNSNSNNSNNNSNIDNKCMITNTKSYVTQLSGYSMNPSFSTLSSSLNSPHKSSVSHLNNNNNNLNHGNNNNSMSTGISSSGISSSHINDGLTRTASILIGSELNSKSISPKFIDYYFNGEQRNRELIGSQLTTTTTTATITTTTTTTTATTVLSMIKYDRNMDENNLRRNNHSVFVNNQFVSNMMNENHKNNLSLVQ
ncbi:Frizzled-5 [Schistosoma haematobium]|nr:Frizzled-5 [Schistosoma haematobium]KAH9596771.1 Frizzled-5 [Schistosoma haematobium]